jgi:hypothetical protein
MRDVLVKSGYTVVQLVQREVPVFGVDSFELAAVNRDIALGEKVLTIAKTVEFLECFLDSSLVVLAEVGYRAKVWGKLTEKPHHLYVYQALTGQFS